VFYHKAKVARIIYNCTNPTKQIWKFEKVSNA
jgi:hypothetical protein